MPTTIATADSAVPTPMIDAAQAGPDVELVLQEERHEDADAEDAARRPRTPIHW